MKTIINKKSPFDEAMDYAITMRQLHSDLIYELIAYGKSTHNYALLNIVENALDEMMLVTYENHRKDTN